MYNFKINENNGIISRKFVELNILDFHSACQFIAKLAYKRNVNKNNIQCVFEDDGGTCSTKHAVLRKLALENKHENVKLILGIFKMDSEYAPLINNTLNKYQLNYIPEAHNYLKIDHQYFDFTRPHSDYKEFENKIIIETEIEFDKINSEKIALHKKYLKKWIIDEDIEYNLEEIWKIREKCIADLQNPRKDLNSVFSPVCFQNSPEVRDEYKQ